MKHIVYLSFHTNIIYMQNQIYFDGEHFIQNPQEANTMDGSFYEIFGFDRFNEEELIRIADTLNKSNAIHVFRKVYNLTKPSSEA